MKRIPTAPRDGERAAHGGRAERALHRAGGDVARAELARLGARGREALELGLGQPDAHLAVDHARRWPAPRRPRARRARRRARPRRPRRRGKPWATSVVSSATTPRPAARLSTTSSASGSRPFTASPPPARRSAARPRARAPCRRRPRRPAGSPRRRHRPRRSLDRARRQRREGRRRAVLVQHRPAGAALVHPRGRGRIAEHVELHLVGEDHVGRDGGEALAQARRPEGADRAPRREVDAHARAAAPRELRRPQRGRRDRVAHEAVAGQVQPRRALQPGRVDLARLEVGRDAAVRDHGAIAVRRHQRDHDARRAPRPAAPGRRRPARAARPRRARWRARRRASRSAGRVPPSAATHAATLAAWPPGVSALVQ